MPATQDEIQVIRNTGPWETDVRIEGHGFSLDVVPASRSVPLVRISAPSFFQNEAFLQWLNGPQRGPATWHVKGEEADGYSDIWTYFGGARWEDGEFHAEGSDYPATEDRPGIPEEIYQLIAQAVLEATGDMDREAVVWIDNLD